MNVKAKERWEKDIDKYDLEHLRLRQIGKLINEINPSSYVDLGCGKGKLGTLTPNAEYVGCDFAMSEGNHNFKFFYCDFNNEQLPAQIYGHPLFACSGLLEYIENVDGVGGPEELPNHLCHALAGVGGSGRNLRH